MNLGETAAALPAPIHYQVPRLYPVLGAWPPILRGDDLGAGRIFATRLGTVLGDALRQFHERGGLILGICNGFQVLVRAGLLPGGPSPTQATLTHNESGRFESRWVRMQPQPGLSPFITDATPIELPVAHGEGKFLLADPNALATLEAAGQVVLRYVDASGAVTEEYPANPNGTPGAVAGLCDPTGRIFGLMPHPERFIDPIHHPRWTRRDPGSAPSCDGLRIFQNAIASLR
ncbi:phosphoribosylformylglycinamidine synthase [Singulisphaera sp. GP187]|uniref:phosphoribosylformylglycinamidine synthase subunit PurQ n=1 Tax=Singulisphaera sp. GP187 TaxID=1882752 RepID=UPI0009285143|nr:phosphoribosylformylglycinamidine synthase subunit PurQ [Singulisphaera sp. GP187]SIN88132.1 phosphoribosylformylglycinamidine synthase [Singulisphaera sp. GP187]